MDGVKKPPRDRSLHLSVEPSQARMAPRRSESGRSVAGANGAAERGASDRGAADRRVLDRIDVPALGFSTVSRDSIGEVEPRFGNAREPRLVGGHAGPFRQIKVCGRQSPVLEIRTHFRTYSTAREKRKAADRVQENVKRHVRFRRPPTYRLRSARKILSRVELNANVMVGKRCVRTFAAH